MSLGGGGIKQIKQINMGKEKNVKISHEKHQLSCVSTPSPLSFESVHGVVLSFSFETVPH
jgi:hypothetical protein